MNETVAGRSRCGCEVWPVVTFEAEIRSLHVMGGKEGFDMKDSPFELNNC